MFAKIDVNGSDTHPLFAWLKNEKRGLGGGAIKWNFTKFLVARDGSVLDRYAPQTRAQLSSSPTSRRHSPRRRDRPQSLLSVA